MQKTIERISGDTIGITYEFPVYRFEGSPDTPSAYIQAALHGGELPGVVAIDALMRRLRKAEAEGRLRGKLTIVPWCNPIGRAQHLFGDLQGRFHLGTRTNFNRDFPLLDSPDAPVPAADDASLFADQRLKARLVALSMGHDIVLDLHCDDEGLPYLYVPAVLWPAMSDCAAAMNMEAVLLWSGDTGASFDQASIHPYLDAAPEVAKLDKRVATTVEYRGMPDVSPELAEADGEGLYRLLVARGIVEDKSLPPVAAYKGEAAPIDHVEIVRSPCAGAILFHVKPGDRVAKGAKLVTVVHSPGEVDGSVDIFAPQAGLVLTRRNRRSIDAGGDLVKLVGTQPSVTAKEGALEN